MRQFLQIDGGVVCQRFDGGSLTPLAGPTMAGPEGETQVPAVKALVLWKERYA
ncbi:MAG: hypothetical protein GY717_12245, partial [Rhodobacteraceae bacterium]|nr:hypothetical protein [Paracoccaceae bacterium]